MVQEGENHSEEKATWWDQVRVWSVATVCIVLFSACFIGRHVACTQNHSASNENMRRGENENMIKEERKWNCCPEKWKSFGSNCYFISTTLATWQGSQKNCERMQAQLLVVDSKEEQNFIISKLEKNIHYFIGLSDLLGKRQWQWVDQTPYNENASLWLPGQPNNVEERCVALYSYGNRGWNDVKCGNKYRSVCKMMKQSL